MNRIDSTEYLLERMNSYIKMLEMLEIEDHKDIIEESNGVINYEDEQIYQYVNFNKHLCSDLMIEKYMVDRKDKLNEEGKEFLKFIRHINSISNRTTDNTDQCILLAMKSLIIGAISTDKDVQKRQLISRSRTLRQLLSK